MENQSEYRYKPEEIAELLAKKLKPSRLEHCQSVAFTAAAIAMYQGVKELKPFLYAGLLHDCAKYMKDSELLEYCRTNGLEISEGEAMVPQLLHGKVGADLARKEYGISDEGILNAIIHHTDGHADMSLIEKAVHLADHMEPLRDYPAKPSLTEIRRLAFTEPDKAVYLLNKNTIEYLERKGGIISPTSYATYEYYRNLVEK